MGDQSYRFRKSTEMDKFYALSQQEHQQAETQDSSLMQGLQSFLHSQTGQSLLSSNANIQQILQNALFKQQPTVITQQTQIPPSNPQTPSLVSERDILESLRNKDVSILMIISVSKQVDFRFEFLFQLCV